MHLIPKAIRMPAPHFTGLRDMCEMHCHAPDPSRITSKPPCQRAPSTKGNGPATACHAHPRSALGPFAMDPRGDAELADDAEPLQGGAVPWSGGGRLDPPPRWAVRRTWFALAGKHWSYMHEIMVACTVSSGDFPMVKGMPGYASVGFFRSDT